MVNKILLVLILTSCSIKHSSIESNLSLDNYKIYYYDNGNKESEGNYTKGIKNGFFKYYRENGKKKSEGYFKNDMKNGIWKEWYENGMREINYVNNARKSIKCWTLNGGDLDCSEIKYH